MKPNIVFLYIYTKSSMLLGAQFFCIIPRLKIWREKCHEDDCKSSTARRQSSNKETLYPKNKGWSLVWIWGTYKLHTYSSQRIAVLQIYSLILVKCCEASLHYSQKGLESRVYLSEIVQILLNYYVYFLYLF